MRVLNLLCGGGAGGIEVLCLEYGQRSSLDNRYLVLWKPGVISDEMKQKGVPVEVYDTAASRYIKDFFRFLKKCKEEKIETLVFHQTSPLIALCVFGCKLFCPNIRIVGYVHSDFTNWTMKERYGAKIAYACAEKVVCISKTVLNSMKHLPGVLDKCVLIFSGVDTKKFVSSRHKPSESCLELIYVGRLHAEKGVENTLRGLASLPREIPFRFRVVGDGPHRQNLEEMCDILGIQASVEFLGTCRDLPTLYQNADVFVHLPNCEEGFGLTIIEAMAAGLICIGNTRGAIPEIIQNGKNGYLLKDDCLLAQILEKVWINRNELFAIKEAAVHSAEEFGMDKYVIRLDRLLSECPLD